MKTCKLKRMVLALTLMLMGGYGAMAQIKPSVYVGLGNYTNLGGTMGVGTEIRYKNFAANAAIGAAYNNGFFKDKEIVKGNPWLGFDVGLKYYVYKGLFGGVNFGVLGKYVSMETQEQMRVRDMYGFSFTLGYKWHYYKGIYGMVYTGMTSSKDANNFLGDLGGIQPRFGLTLGYDFKH